MLIGRVYEWAETIESFTSFAVPSRRVAVKIDAESLVTLSASDCEQCIHDGQAGPSKITANAEGRDCNRDDSELRFGSPPHFNLSPTIVTIHHQPSQKCVRMQ
jgi:hypothetical protein